jgi:hypothetical protein
VRVAGHPAPTVTVTCSNATPLVTSHFIVNLRGQGGFRARLDDFVQVWRQAPAGSAAGNTEEDDNTTAEQEDEAEAAPAERVLGSIETELNEDRSIITLRFFPAEGQLHPGDAVTVRLARDAVNLGQWHSSQFPYFTPPASTSFTIPAPAAPAAPAAPTPVRLRVHLADGRETHVHLSRSDEWPLEELRATLVAAGAPLSEGHSLTIACGLVQIADNRDVLLLREGDTIVVGSQISELHPRAPGGK